MKAPALDRWWITREIAGGVGREVGPRQQARGSAEAHGGLNGARWGGVDLFVASEQDAILAGVGSQVGDGLERLEDHVLSGIVESAHNVVQAAIVTR